MKTPLPVPRRETVCSCRNLVFSLLVSAVLLQLVHYSRAPDRGGLPINNLSSRLFRLHSPLPSPSHPVTCLLVVSSNPRSGSSFTGELLSAAPQSSFFFEPLWSYVDHNHHATLEDKRSLLLNLLQCNFHDPHIRRILRSNKQATFIFRKPSVLGLKKESAKETEMMGYYRKMEMRCRRTRTRVVKTIRLSMTELQSILNSLPEFGTVNRKNVHVIYLTRDPRGILNSVRNLPSQWPSRLLQPRHICSRLLNDSVQQSRENISQLMVLRYEDLALNPAEQLTAVEDRFNLSLTNRESRKFLQEHSKSNWIGGKDSTSGKWGRSRAGQPEDPVRDLVLDLAQQTEELEEDVVVPGEEDRRWREKEEEGDSTGVDYYDEKGKIATLRRRKRWTAMDWGRRYRAGQEKPKWKIRKAAEKDKDPQGRSFYYSTYRDKNFSPDHWRKQLPQKLVDEVAKEPACREVLERFGYPQE